MLERYKSSVLATAVALALTVQGVEAVEDQATNGESQPVTEETGPEAKADDTSPSNGMKTFDAVAVRPVTFVSSVFSTGAFILALPFAAFDPAMDVEKTRKNLVDYPYQDTFRRPLGDFSGSAWGEP